MFTVKVVYRGQIRKLTFSNTNTFPTYSEICDQLNRVFSIPSSFYFSKLLFSPDASQPSRVLIGKEVHHAYDYAKCIRPFKNRTWPNALLRLTVCDPISGTTASSRSFSTAETPLTVDNSKDISMSHKVSQPFSFASSTPTPSQPPMNVDAFLASMSMQSNAKTPAQNDVPTAQHARAPSKAESCCSVSEGKAEIRAMLTEFKSVIDRVVRHDLATPEDRSLAIPVTEAPPPSLCSICLKSAAGTPNGEGLWYSCESCHVVVCADCHSKERPGFCLNLMGPHRMELVRAASGQDTDLPIPHLPSPWTPRPISASLAFSDSPLGPNTSNGQRDSTPQNAAKTSATTPIVHSVIHRGVVCDSCNATIEGVRHKCLDCPDYDLCTPCISVGCAEAHNPFHEFYEIAEPGRVVVHNVFSGNGEREIRRERRRQSSVPTPPTQPTVHLATCDLCDSRILGVRYKCINCPDFDTCESCYSIVGEQHPKHAFVRIHKQDDYLRSHSAQRPMHYATCDGCNKRIYGARFKCMHPECPDYDLCESCEALPIAIHPDNHPLLKMKAADTVIPTVYRVGQKDLIPGARSAEAEASQSSRRSTSPLPPRVPSPPFFVEERVQTPTPVIRVIPAAHSPAPTMPSPAPTQSPVGPPPLPPKPEMISPPTWASIPPYVWPPVTLDIEPFPSFAPAPVPLRTEEARASLRNPFADIAIPETPKTPVAPEVPAAESPRQNLVETPHRVKTPEITLPSVPSHAPNPWPTTNPTERQELLQLIADFAGPSTSPNVIDALSGPAFNEMRSIEDKKTWASLLRSTSQPQLVPPPPPTLAPVNCNLPVNPLLRESPALPSLEVVPKNEETNTDTLSPEDRVNAGFRNFSMPHLLEDLEDRVSWPKDEPKQEPKPASSIAGSISGEDLLKRPSQEILASNLGTRRSLARLINDVPFASAADVPSVKVENPVAQGPLTALFVEDVTVPDGQVFPPGAEFMKCWRLFNNGPRDWPESTELVFVAGESLSLSTEGGATLSVGIGKVAAGAETEVWTGELKAPDAPGPYVGYWRLKADGEVFGDSLWIEINVAEADSHSSSESMASSSVIMPTTLSAPQSEHVASITVRTTSVPTDMTSTEDNMSDAGSDISLISMPSSPSVSDDEAIWHDTRSHATSELSGAPTAGASAQPTHESSAIDYVLLYDDSSSSEE